MTSLPPRKHQDFRGYLRHFPAAQAVSILILGASCKPRPQPEQVATDLRNVQIMVVERSGAFGVKASHSFELSGCGDNAKSPQVKEPNLLIFKVAAIRSGEKCRLEILDPSLEGKANIRWYEREPVTYLAQEIKISRGNVGQLEGTAFLTRSYEERLEPEQAYQLRIPVSFPPSIRPLQKASTQLQCEPHIPGSTNNFTIEGGTNVSFYLRLKLGSPTNHREVSCSKVIVTVDANNWSAALDPPLKFEVQTEGKVVNLRNEPIPLDLEDPQKLEVVIRQADCKKDGQVFDIEQRVCADRP